MTNNVEQTAANGTAPDTQTAAVACTQCILMKAKRAISLVWGKRPELKSWPYNEREETRVSVVSYYKAAVVQQDAIIKILVSDT
jgi:hypothetical protein